MAEIALGGATLNETDRQILMREIDGVLAAQPRERVVFWLYYSHGLSAREIAAMPGFELSTKGVESLLLRLTSRVRTVLQPGAGKGKSSPETLTHE